MVQRRTATTKKQPPPKGTSPATRKKSVAAASPPEPAPIAATMTAAVPASNPIMETELPAQADAAQAVPSPASVPPTTAETGDSKSEPKPKIEPRVLDVFLIDSGWNNPVCAAVHENLPTVAAYLKGHRFFVMNPDQSLTFIRRHPGLVGADPLLLVLDRKAAAKKDPAGCGFRLSLGHVRQPEVAISMLKWAVQLTMTATTSEMASIVRKSGQKETLQGVIELVGEGSTHLLEFAPV